jgi:predicted dehydrogenase
MKTLSRRDFLKSSLLTAAALSLPARAWAQVAGANDDIRVAVVGFGGRGGGHISEFSKIKGVRLVALCDCDQHILEAGARRFTGQGTPVKTYQDFRKLLEDKDVDAISSATPNHWHSLNVVWACQAGKDVYIEKPVSHNVWEGRKAVEASRKYNRIVQAGTQSRSSGALREALDWVRAGNLGKIQVARGLCYKRRPSIGKVDGPQPIPEYIDYDLWCGPALKLPLMRQKLHYDWHWVWNTGSGDIGNQGIHQMDIARWALGKDALSPRIVSVGGRFGYVDDGETPNTQFALHDYGDALLIFEVRGLPSGPVGPNEEGAGGKKPKETMDLYRGQSVGHVIECEGGYLSGTTACDKDGKAIKRFTDQGEDHFGNFIKAVRSRKREDQNADILEGHLSSALCHTGNISHRLGQQAEQPEIREALKSNSAALETLGRFEEHLARNKVDLKIDKATMGVFLQMDPKTERFLGNDKANELLTRPYRAPFIVPAKV